MSNAKIDENGRPTMIGVLNTTPTTIMQVKANSSNHALKINDGTSGTDNGNNGGNALLDENSFPVLMALSSAGTGALVEVYVDSAGALMVDST